jgi:putative restriction endonuclease
MPKAIFTTKVDPTYDDLPEERYHFPRTYLRQVEAVRGDWIVYYEPRRGSGDLSSRGGRQSYFATARVDRIETDPARSDHFYAFVSEFLEFDRPVPFREGARYFETGLERADGKTNKGAFGRAVRQVSDIEYDLILQAGFVRTLGELSEQPEADSTASEFDDESVAFRRPIVEQVVRRPFREAAFAARVKDAYENTCAMTGLKIINGGGRAEVQAAHIRPVAHDGPDSIRNGLALSGTVHWMFDRGLVSVDDDWGILIAKDRLPDTVTRLLGDDRRILPPKRAGLRPHASFLRYHRERIFKG